MSWSSVAPLAKVSLLFISTRLAALALTPPMPPVSAEEAKAYQNAKDPAEVTFVRSMLTTHVLPVKAICYVNAICESLVILAKLYPSGMSETVLAFLVRAPLRASHSIGMTPWRLAGCLAMIAGGLIRCACYRELGQLFTYELSVKKDHTLITTGPYSVVRHPAYTGIALLGLGILLCHFGPGSWFAECIGWSTWQSWVYAGVWGSWLMMAPVVLAARMPMEDEVLMYTRLCGTASSGREVWSAESCYAGTHKECPIRDKTS